MRKLGPRMAETLQALREHGGTMTGKQIREWLGYKSYTLHEIMVSLQKRGLVTARLDKQHGFVRAATYTLIEEKAA